jgi:hypothetical protein
MCLCELRGTVWVSWGWLGIGLGTSRRLGPSARDLLIFGTISRDFLGRLWTWKERIPAFETIEVALESCPRSIWSRGDSDVYLLTRARFRV